MLFLKYSVFFVILTVLMSYGIFPCTAADLISDFTTPDSPLIEQTVVSAESERNAKNGADFLFALNEVIRGRKFTDQDLKRFANLLDATPDSPFLLFLLLGEAQKNGKMKLLGEELLKISGNHPEQLMLAAVAADIMTFEKKNEAAFEILKKSTDSVLRSKSPGLLVANSAGYGKYVFLKYALQLTAEKQYSESEAFLKKISSWKTFAGNTVLMQLNLINRDALRKQASSDRILGVFPSDKQNAEESFAAAAEEYLKEMNARQLKSGSVALSRHTPALGLLSEDANYKQQTAALLWKNLIANPTDLSTQLFLVNLFAREKDHANAARLWKRIFNQLSNRPIVFYLSYAQELALSGKIKEAMELYDLARLMNANDASLDYHQVRTLYQTGQYRKILELMKEKEIPSGCYLAALAAFFLGEKQTALDYFEKFAKLPEAQRRLFGGSHSTVFLHAECADAAGNHKRSEELIREYLRQKPDSAEALNWLGYSFADRNVNLDEAERMIRGALEQKPDSAEYQDSMAWLLYRRKQYAEAMDWIKKSIASSKTFSPTICDHAGDIAFALGDKKEAVRYWKEAVGTYSPEPVDVKKILAKITAAGGSL